MYEVLFEKGFGNDFIKLKLNEQDYDKIVQHFKLIAQNKNLIPKLNKLQGSKESIFYDKFKFNKDEKYRVFVYINFQNETLNIIGISKRKDSYKNHELKKLNARIIQNKQKTLSNILQKK